MKYSKMRVLFSVTTTENALERLNKNKSLKILL